MPISDFKEALRQIHNWGHKLEDDHRQLGEIEATLIKCCEENGIEYNKDCSIPCSLENILENLLDRLASA